MCPWAGAGSLGNPRLYRPSSPCGTSWTSSRATLATPSFETSRRMSSGRSLQGWTASWSWRQAPASQFGEDLGAALCLRCPPRPAPSSRRPPREPSGSRAPNYGIPLLFHQKGEAGDAGPTPSSPSTMTTPPPLITHAPDPPLHLLAGPDGPLSSHRCPSAATRSRRWRRTSRVW